MEKTIANIKITSWFRESTMEWVAEMDLKGCDYYANTRMTGHTEKEALCALYAAIGYQLLEMQLEK